MAKPAEAKRVKSKPTILDRIRKLRGAPKKAGKSFGEYLIDHVGGGKGKDMPKPKRIKVN